MNYFITGTDTGVGKTFVTALLTRAARKRGCDTVALKPICCGAREDVDILREACGGELSPDEINPLWFETPAAPLVAARREKRGVDIGHLAAWFRHHRARRRSLLIEGAGGWLVPIAEKQTMARLAALFELPVLIVVANRLGCLNHTLLTVESIRAHGLQCAGLALNTMTNDDSAAVATNRQVLEEFCEVPVLYDIRPGQTSLA